MFFSQTGKKLTSNKVLIAPLDWGLGHATRCIPIIHAFNNRGCVVIIAAQGPLKILLKQEFPNNLFVSLPAYNIQYSKSQTWLFWKLFTQLPKIISVILREHHWLKNLIKTHSIDIVISDNRFGLFNHSIKSIYITHQLNFKTGNSFFNKVAAKIHQLFIKKYTACWVPDFDTEPSLAGELSHPEKKIDSIKYIGCLSRFEKLAVPVKVYDLLVLISGPEPQRTIFEKTLVQQLSNFKGSILFLRGLPGTETISQPQSNLTQNIIFKNHVNAAELSIAIQQSKIVVCRSGYTTIMDLVKLKQVAILVPTPGQAEQEYLADYLMKKGIFYSVRQEDFTLEDSISKARVFSYQFPEVDMNLYSQQVDDLLKHDGKFNLSDIV